MGPIIRPPNLPSPQLTPSDTPFPDILHPPTDTTTFPSTATTRTPASGDYRELAIRLEDAPEHATETPQKQPQSAWNTASTPPPPFSAEQLAFLDHHYSGNVRQSVDRRIGELGLDNIADRLAALTDTAENAVELQKHSEKKYEEAMEAKEETLALQRQLLSLYDRIESIKEEAVDEKYKAILRILAVEQERDGIDIRLKKILWLL
ncbi:hypothetical protein HK097_000581 [Rhizophlyctis rosea]|uniref:Uncharacterized protein n=1 Tax=Rhizophlyctis rosea TaxID=64517 RepID=A0AAD5SHC7_9FUNG|nr:hypothetical protein HK097_000581 [Rhizophlyctis rosea]